MRKNRNLKNNTGTQSRSLQSTNTTQRTTDFNYEVGREFANRTPYTSGINSTRQYTPETDDVNTQSFAEEYGSDYERRNNDTDYESSLSNHAAGNTNTTAATNTEFAEDNCCGACDRNRRK